VFYWNACMCAISSVNMTNKLIEKMENVADEALEQKMTRLD